jgi:transposase
MKISTKDFCESYKGGMSRKQMALKYGISTATVEIYLKKFAKAGLITMNKRAVIEFVD